MHPDLQRLLARDLLPDVTAVPLDDLRSLRIECSKVEGDVSLVRRITQGRLDIVGHETRRRSGAAEADSDVNMTDLLFDLPDILADSPAGGGGGGSPSGRKVVIDGPGIVAQALIKTLDTTLTPAELGSLDSLDDDQLNTLMESLRDFEIELSTTRRRLHERIDSIQSEVTRRYRDGEASIDSLLN
ncbi:MAG: hypothetical protein GY939_12225 [Actinomycetia bacterium]|nr:hypothetical protein [Actinomycetes bacterium]